MGKCYFKTYNKKHSFLLALYLKIYNPCSSFWLRALKTSWRGQEAGQAVNHLTQAELSLPPKAQQSSGHTPT